MISNFLSQLLNEFEANEITYCHWKSNSSLKKSISGERDFDFLVERRCLREVEAIFRKLKCKLTVPKWGLGTPGEYHYYGFDPKRDQFIHLHLMNLVLSGESYVKSHVFPFESMLLENTDQIDQIRVASKPAELVLFVIRIFIKYGALLDLVQLIKQDEDIKNELRWLKTGTDIDDAVQLLNKYCPVIDKNLFARCVNTLNKKGALTERIWLARRVRHRLRVYAKYNIVTRFLAHLQLMWWQVQRRLHRNKRNKILYSGGGVIAFVGPDAVGKSTLVAECGGWLGQVLDVEIVHAGRPPTSCLTSPVNLLLPLVRKILSGSSSHRLDEKGLHTKPSQAQVKGFYSLVYALRALSLAWDRRQLLVAAKRSAANGKIIICDRYPSLVIGAMDSRRLETTSYTNGPIAAIYNWMARLEERIYKQISPPDIAIRLTVSLETAKRRNSQRMKAEKEQDAQLEYRHHQSARWQMSGIKCIHDIDTDQSLSDTLMSAKRVIWEWL